MKGWGEERKIGGKRKWFYRSEGGGRDSSATATIFSLNLKGFVRIVRGGGGREGKQWAINNWKEGGRENNGQGREKNGL